MQALFRVGGREPAGAGVAAAKLQNHLASWLRAAQQHASNTKAHGYSARSSDMKQHARRQPCTRGKPGRAAQRQVCHRRLAVQRQHGQPPVPRSQQHAVGLAAPAQRAANDGFAPEQRLRWLAFRRVERSGGALAQPRSIELQKPPAHSCVQHEEELRAAEKRRRVRSRAALRAVVFCQAFAATPRALLLTQEHLDEPRKGERPLRHPELLVVTRSALGAYELSRGAKATLRAARPWILRKILVAVLRVRRKREENLARGKPPSLAERAASGTIVGLGIAVRTYVFVVETGLGGNGVFQPVYFTTDSAGGYQGKSDYEKRVS